MPYLHSEQTCTHTHTLTRGEYDEWEGFGGWLLYYHFFESCKLLKNQLKLCLRLTNHKEIDTSEAKKKKLFI